MTVALVMAFVVASVKVQMLVVWQITQVGDGGSDVGGDGLGDDGGDGNLLENKLLQFGRGGDEPDITVLFHLV